MPSSKSAQPKAVQSAKAPVKAAVKAAVKAPAQMPEKRHFYQTRSQFADLDAQTNPQILASLPPTRYSPQAARVFARQAPETLERISALIRAGFRESGESIATVWRAAQEDGIQASWSRVHRMTNLTGKVKSRGRKTAGELVERRNGRNGEVVDVVLTGYLLARAGLSLEDISPVAMTARSLSSDEQELLRTFRELSSTGQNSVLQIAATLKLGEQVVRERPGNVSTFPSTAPSTFPSPAATAAEQLALDQQREATTQEALDQLDAASAQYQHNLAVEATEHASTAGQRQQHTQNRRRKQ